MRENYTVETFRQLEQDKEANPTHSKLKICGGSSGKLRQWQKWVKAGRPGIWPPPAKKKVRDVAPVLSNKEVRELMKGEFDRDGSKSKIEEMTYKAIIRNLGVFCKAADIKVAIEFLQLVHPDYQEKAKGKDVLSVYVEAINDLLEGNNGKQGKSFHQYKRDES